MGWLVRVGAGLVCSIWLPDRHCIILRSDSVSLGSYRCMGRPVQSYLAWPVGVAGWLIGWLAGFLAG